MELISEWCRSDIADASLSLDVNGTYERLHFDFQRDGHILMENLNIVAAG